MLSELASLDDFEHCGQTKLMKDRGSSTGRRYRLLRQLFPSHHYEVADLPDVPPPIPPSSSNPWSGVATGMAPEPSSFTETAPGIDLDSTGWNQFFGQFDPVQMGGSWQSFVPVSEFGFTGPISTTESLAANSESVDPLAWLGISPYGQTLLYEPDQWQ